jgi:hypothetical protein
MSENLPARWIGQRGKSSVQRSRRIFNHLVNYLAALLQRANFFLLTILQVPATALSLRSTQRI